MLFTRHLTRLLIKLQWKLHGYLLCLSPWRAVTYIQKMSELDVLPSFPTTPF
jgi:hypothetical protein